MYSFNLRALRLPLALAACILAGPALAHDLELQAPDLRAADLSAGSGAGVHHAGAGYWEVAPRIELAVPLTDSSVYSVGPKLGLEAMYSFGEIAPKLEFEAGGRFGFTYLSANFPADSLSIFEVVPEARLLIPLSPKFRLYGETGLGLALVSGGGNSVAGDLRFGFGGTYELSPTVNVLIEPIGFNTYFKSGSLTTYNLALGLQFRM